ncbi:MAG TPA: hypothetical protein VJN18_11500 [Polyangiaceae bacterium]|nr:hypothetical protein [Polyangiaceae bacterium]
MRGASAPFERRANQRHTALEGYRRAEASTRHTARRQQPLLNSPLPVGPHENMRGPLSCAVDRVVRRADKQRIAVDRERCPEALATWIRGHELLFLDPATPLPHEHDSDLTVGGTDDRGVSTDCNRASEAGYLGAHGRRQALPIDEVGRRKRRTFCA